MFSRDTATSFDILSRERSLKSSLERQIVRLWRCQRSLKLLGGLA